MCKKESENNKEAKKSIYMNTSKCINILKGFKMLNVDSFIFT